MGGKNFMMQTVIYFVSGIDFIVLTQFLFNILLHLMLFI